VPLHVIGNNSLAGMQACDEVRVSYAGKMPFLAQEEVLMWGL
jgi:hypothetical protein